MNMSSFQNPGGLSYQRVLYLCLPVHSRDISPRYAYRMIHVRLAIGLIMQIGYFYLFVCCEITPDDWRPQKISIALH